VLLGPRDVHRRDASRELVGVVHVNARIVCGDECARTHRVAGPPDAVDGLTHEVELLGESLHESRRQVPLIVLCAAHAVQRRTGRLDVDLDDLRGSVIMDGAPRGSNGCRVAERVRTAFALAGCSQYPAAIIL
jgi:hypothetical protein